MLEADEYIPVSAVQITGGYTSALLAWFFSCCFKGSVISYETKCHCRLGRRTRGEEDSLCDTALQATNFGFLGKIKKS
jgi:hypothetical protein